MRKDQVFGRPQANGRGSVRKRFRRGLGRNLLLAVKADKVDRIDQQGRMTAIISIGDVVKALLTEQAYEVENLRSYVAGGS